MSKAIELYVKATTGLEYLRRSQRGQGTVEYVGIILVVAAICFAIIGAAGGFGGDLAQKISDGIKQAIDKVLSAG